jgi:hypothetical protein
MQVYALNTQGERVFIENAEKSRAYFCLECGQELYARSGQHILPHFYHLHPKTRCSQEAKSARHIELQKTIRERFCGRCQEEVRFSKINRIADLFVEEEKLVIEVQCSPIRKEEVQARVSDYRSLGLEICWILDMKRFGKRKVSAAENSLFQIPHYFALERELLDVVDVVNDGLRKERLFIKPIHIERVERRAASQERVCAPSHENITCRFSCWPIHVKDDFIDAGGRLLQSLPKPLMRKRTPFVFSAVANFLRSLWHIVLTNSCR